MAVEFLIGVVAENLFNQSLFFATEEISLFIGCEESLAKLKAGEVKIIQDFLADVHNKDIKSIVVQSWFKDLKAVLFDAENVLEEYNYKLLHQNIPQDVKVHNFFSPIKNFAFNLKIAHKIKAINYELKRVSEQAREYGLIDLLNRSPEVKMDRVRAGPSVQEEDIVGRDEDVAKVVDMLVSENNEQNIALTAIVGMGGQGKTTVAQLVYKHNKVVTHFEKRVWVCVSDDFKIERLLSDMVQSLTKENPNLTTRESLIGKLQDTLKGKRYLVVLDDVWNLDQQKWELMKNDLLEIGGSKGTKILVTTRSKKVVSIMHASQTYDLYKLSDEDSWSLFKKRAFVVGGVVEAPEFVAIGKTIIKKCCGVPLAIKVLGGLLSSKIYIREWSSIESSDIWSSFENQERENQEGGVMSCIKLSYDHLASLPLKQCFVYCSIFPKDAELERESLIQQWMAHGFLNPPRGSTLQMEDLGSNYFDILLCNTLLQEPSPDGYYKMHDIVHDFALQISKDYCFTMDDIRDVNDIDEAVHVSLIDIPQGISSKIRTLRLSKGVKPSNINVLSKFECLRNLILCSWEIEELPTSIGRLKLLRYLDIQDTSIRTLPDSYIKLYNLQTLRLPFYFQQEFLYVDTLVNLRHIYMYSARCRVVGIKQFVNLQTLTHFVVSNEKSCNIDELENLNNLRGSLRIVGLDKVMNGEEAQKANISKKLKIHHLELHWTNSVRDVVNEEVVLEGLIPHPFLSTLTIKYYKGLRFPSWMIKPTTELLINLMEIELEGCDLVEQLPPLGHLPHLLKVIISKLENVKRIGEEFYGCTDDLSSISCAFPALEDLSIDGMSNLEEWLDVEQLSPSLQAFPHLRSLSIWDCGKLSDLPFLTGLTSLTDLFIEGNEILTKIVSLEGLSSLRELSIEGNEKLTTIVSLEGLSSLTQLSIARNEQLTEIPSLQGLRSLTKLLFEGNEKLTRFISLQGLSSLTKLLIKEKPRLIELPSLQGLTSLTELSIERNEKLSTIVSLQDLSALTKLSFIENQMLTVLPSFQGLTSLTELSIEGNEKLTTIVSIQGLSSLTKLSIKKNQRLTILPSLQDLTSLTELCIIENEKLTDSPIKIESCTSLETVKCTYNKSLQRIDGLEHLPNLRNLYIGGFSEKMDFFPWLHNNNEDNHLYFGSLMKLKLYGWPKLMSLPEQLQYLPSLTFLLIYQFNGLEALPEWLGNIKSLSSLHLRHNRNLKYMPSTQAMQRLTNLKQLYINCCRNLQQRCIRESGPEWHKISHIQNIEMDYDWM